MMPEVSATTFLPVALATGTATFVGRWFFGAQPAFYVPVLPPLNADLSSAFVLCLYALLGATTGLAAAGFIRGLHFAEDLFDKIPNRYWRHCLGMLAVGVIFYLLFAIYGHYYVEGVGYSTIQSILLGQMTGMGLLALLFACKMLATSLSLGSGSSGGIFSPSLFMGATIGATLAAALQWLHVPLPISIPTFAMIGMGAMVGGGTGAVMTAVTMIFEMTRDYDVVMPMILAVAVSVGVRRLLSRENIYTLKLVRRGHAIPKALHANMFLVRRAKEVMDTDVAVVSASDSFEEFLTDPRHGGRMRHVVVMRDSRIFRIASSERGSVEDIRGDSESRFHPCEGYGSRIRRDPAHVAQGGHYGCSNAKRAARRLIDRRRSHHEGAHCRFDREYAHHLSGLSLALAALARCALFDKLSGVLLNDVMAMRSVRIRLRRHWFGMQYTLPW
jgi:CIC family chloride channel protein